MVAIGSLTAKKIVSLLAADAGLPASVAQVAAEQSIPVAAFSAQQIPAGLRPSPTSMYDWLRLRA